LGLAVALLDIEVVTLQNVMMSRALLGLIGAICVATLAFATPASASSNLIVNGTFSSPVVGAGSDQFIATGATFSGWRVMGAPGNIAIMSGTFLQNGFTFDADATSQWLDLTGTSNSATGVVQTISTVNGLRYTLRFATGNTYDPGGIFGVSSSIDVRINGRLLLRATNSGGRGTTRQVWQNFSTAFVATSNVTHLEFLNEDPSTDTENGLDDVSVTQFGSGVAPSSIATSLPTPRQALLPLSSLAVNGGIAAAVALLLTFPSQLFNQTLQENYADLALWWRRKTRWLTFRRRPSPKDEVGATKATPPHEIARDLSYLEKRWVFILVFVGGVFANAFNDGNFGLTISSLVTLIAVACALAIGVTVPALVGAMYHTVRHGSSPRKLMALPAGLALAIVMVVFSRLIHFEPGYLYGFVCGVLFTRQLPTNEKGHLAALGVCATLVLSALAWIAWIPVNAAALRPDPFVGVVLLDDLLAALFVSGLVGSFFGMMPVRGLPGWTVKQWSNWAWAAAFGVTILGLFQILLRPGIAGHGHRPLVVSIILFVLFGAGSVLFHEHFERRKRRAHLPEPVPVGHALDGARPPGKFEWRSEDVEVLASDDSDGDDVDDESR
jgi:hypothetical protein